MSLLSWKPLRFRLPPGNEILPGSIGLCAVPLHHQLGVMLAVPVKRPLPVFIIHNVIVVVLYNDIQSGFTGGVGKRSVRAVVQQEMSEMELSVEARLVERSGAIIILRVHVCSVGDKVRDHFPLVFRTLVIAFGTCDVQRGAAHLIPGTYIGAVGEEEFDESASSAVTCVMERGETEFGVSVVHS